MSRITATFSVLSDNIEPDNMTKILSFVPDHTVIKGNRRNPPRPVPRSFGWYVTHVNENDTEAALSALLDRIAPLCDRLTDLRKLDESVRVKFSLAIVPTADTIPLYFNRAIIEKMAKFGGDFDVEFFDA